ncbi:hypothetical protein D9M68_865980 [compost metagenome]
MFDTQGAEGKAQQFVAQLPGRAGAAADMADQDLLAIVSEYPFQAACHLPGPGSQQVVARGE